MLVCELMKAVKILAVVVAALALQGCVHYYYNYEPPLSARESGAWDPYADDRGTPVVDVRIADAAYYPWWSIDYYYLGRHWYRPAYLNGPHYSLHYGHGVPPYYWPYYGFYSPFYYPYSTWAWYDPWYGWPRYGIGTTIVFTSNDLHPRLETSYIPPQAARTLNTVGVSTLEEDLDTSLEARRTGRQTIVDGRIGPAPVIRSSRPTPGTSPVSQSAQPGYPVTASPPTMVRQVEQTPARPVTAAPPASSPAPVTSAPRMIRQVRPVQSRPPQSRPRVAQPPPGPTAPSPTRPSTMDSPPPSYADDPSRRRK